MKSVITNSSGKGGFSVTPYEVRGEVDYSKLIKEFGLKHLPKLPKEFEENILFRRGVIFAHRDFDKIIDCVKNKKKFVMMTGLMPSGEFHLGHMLIAQQIILYQKLGAKIYLAVADLEAYLTRGKSLEELRKIAIDQYLVNYIALGLKPEKVDFYFQSDRSKDSKKANSYYSLVSEFSKAASFNEFKAVYGELSPARIQASLLQAADMFHPQLKEFEGKVPVIVPVGADQDPHLRIARDMKVKMREYDFNQLSSTYNVFLPSLKGGSKMSSSDPMSHIAMTDSPSEVKNKINKYAFSGGKDTLEEHRKHGGNPDVDVSFQYLKMFFEPDDKKLEKIEKDYRSGKLLTGELKAYLIEKINAFLKEHQKKRKLAEKQVDKFIFKG